MRSIDVHAHLTPQCFIHAMQAGQEWHGIHPGSVRIALRAVWTPEQRIADMNSLGVDVQVVSTGAGFYYYDREAQTVAAMHRECNDEVHQMTMDHPERFMGIKPAEPHAGRKSSHPLQKLGKTLRALKEAYARH